MRSTRLISIMVATSLAAAAGVVTTTLVASAAPSYVRLHLGTDALRFSLGSATQPITVGKNSCAINSPETLIDLSSVGNQPAPGLSNYGLGIKGSPSSGNGSPCAQVDPAERLIMKPGTNLPGRTFKSLRFDVEMTGNAIVVITVARGLSNEVYKLQTGNNIQSAQSSESDYDTSAPYFASSTMTDNVDACASPNSSGPNSAGNDNCQWTITPSFNFDTITLTTEVGTVTLEGAGDFANNPAFDSLFELSNAAPSAVDDNVITNEDTAITFNVLTNDLDGDGDGLTVTGNGDPTYGTLSFASPGSFTYTPDPGEHVGSDSFTYNVSDGIDGSTATVNIIVTPVNDPPESISGEAETPEETAVTIVVATDIDSTVLTATCTSVPSGGSIVDNGDGSITFTPPLNFNGGVTITCSVVDDQGAATATSAVVTVGVTPVNDAPVAVVDTGEIDQDLNVLIDVLSNDTDIEFDTLSVSLAAVTGSVSPANGSAVVEGTSIRYTPNPTFSGTDSFTYRAFDGDAYSNLAIVTVNVCTVGAVTDQDGQVGQDVEATFVLLSETDACKQYAVDAVKVDPVDGESSVLFTPSGGEKVNYRGYLSFEPQAASVTGPLSLLLEYDPLGGEAFKPVRWCINPQFDGAGDVTTATLPTGETWCIAGETSRGDINGEAVTVWQVFGYDDPKFQ